ncbi:unnamed protein product [Rodentolepis nana]|uniref:G_PROTEIN_RECEP_F1_2 domain-containing protein n=1 Tax=Rodentolepis nana TaxID=102285 RepID=A0A0R3TS03_RODNA|nr:unnamed protein product [Rodentolepis nana]
MHDHTDELDTYNVIIICFTVSFAFLVIHLITLIFFKKARRLYGIAYFLGQIFLSMAALLTLVSCGLDHKSQAFEIIPLAANFGYLVNISAQTLTAILTLLFTLQTEVTLTSSPGTGEEIVTIPRRRIDGNRSCIRRILVNAVALTCIFGLPLCMVLQQSFVPIVNKTSILEVNISGNTVQRDLCSFKPNAETLYFLLTPALLLLIIQIVVISIALRKCSSSVEGINKHLKRHQRLMVLFKMCLGQLLVWSTAVLALIMSSNTLWTIFALSMALESIFSATVCILSRPVIGAILSLKYRGEGDETGGINFANGIHRSISDDDREILHACQYKLGDDNERYYY